MTTLLNVLIECKVIRNAFTPTEHEALVTNFMYGVTREYAMNYPGFVQILSECPSQYAVSVDAVRNAGSLD